MLNRNRYTKYLSKMVNVERVRRDTIQNKERLTYTNALQIVPLGKLTRIYDLRALARYIS